MKNLIGREVIVRGYQSGVYLGTLLSQEGQKVELTDVRNIWSWFGANHLFDLAQNGPDTSHSETEISKTIDSIELIDVVEIVPCSDKVIKIIEEAKPWIYEEE